MNYEFHHKYERCNIQTREELKQTDSTGNERRKKTSYKISSERFDERPKFQEDRKRITSQGG